MPPTEGWNRKQELEDDSDYDFIWENRKGKAQLRIFENSSGNYQIDVRGVETRKRKPGVWRWFRISGFDSQEHAKQYCLRIAEDHPVMKHGIYAMNRVRHGRSGYSKKPIEEIEVPWHKFDTDRTY